MGTPRKADQTKISPVNFLGAVGNDGRDATVGIIEEVGRVVKPRPFVGGVVEIGPAFIDRLGRTCVVAGEEKDHPRGVNRQNVRVAV